MSDGKTTIAPEVLNTIARLTALGVSGVSRLYATPIGVNRLFAHNYSEGVRVEVIDDAVYVNLHVVLKNDVNIREVARNIQGQVSRAIEETVGMKVGRVNVQIEDIDYPEERES